MSKRKLTRRQKWRIEKIQSEKQRRLQQNESEIAELSSEVQQDTRIGLVIAKHGKQIEIEDLSENSGQYLCHMRANIPDMVVGDEVIWTHLEESEDKNLGIIESLRERDSLLSRRDKHGNEKIIAANISRVFLVLATEPETPPAVLDRYLCACELLDLEVTLLVNKSDLEGNKELLLSLQSHYSDVVRQILVCSKKNPEQLQQLAEALADENSVFIGQSGVGKSSLVKHIIQDYSIKTQSLSDRSGLGQHTTSTSRLYTLENGGCIIDSPGIRDFDLDEITLEQLQQGFKEFAQINEACKFRDCVHNTEPGCKIREAVEQGSFSTLRYENYLELADQLDLIK